MRLRITRRIRTANSEQWTLYDADRRDVSGQMENIGKLDLHYDEEMVYGTLLLWNEFVSNIGEESTQAIIDDLMEEATGPIGVSATYSLDFFSPSLSDYKFYTNDEEYEEEEEEDEEDEDEESGPGSNGRSNWH
ncbi:MAG TPA: hypothetical protein VH186_03000 [Chloroflexia bacterium]|nr:hypothetical protein [Chloroflexia bacterium]